MEHCLVSPVPGWVPEGAQRYLAHTEAGLSIRNLARQDGCHASTVMRQIRRIESRRDDPLVDAALTALAACHFPSSRRRKSAKSPKEHHHMQMSTCTQENPKDVVTPDGPTLDREASRVLRRLCETGAVLAVAEDMDKAVVVRDTAGTSARTAVVECAIAQAMALKDWIACSAPGRISRYHITPAGRAALSRMLADGENRAQNATGFAEAQAAFGDQHREWGEKTVDGDGDGRPKRVRYNMAESPLTALARRKDRDGTPFLSETLVRAGERLREDFELAQMGPKVAQNWDRFLTGGARSGFVADSGFATGSSAARDRVSRALADLGPGLSDVALRCCCYLEGLETAEKKMGWSARSGKIVLRIALQRLHRHYDDTANAASNMIG